MDTHDELLPETVFADEMSAWKYCKIFWITDDPNNTNYGEKSKTWRCVIAVIKELFLSELRLSAPLNEQIVSNRLDKKKQVSSGI
jgi:hypothetical protein